MALAKAKCLTQRALRSAGRLAQPYKAPIVSDASSAAHAVGHQPVSLNHFASGYSVALIHSILSSQIALIEVVVLAWRLVALGG